MTAEPLGEPRLETPEKKPTTSLVVRIVRTEPGDYTVEAVGTDDGLAMSPPPDAALLASELAFMDGPAASPGQAMEWFGKELDTQLADAGWGKAVHVPTDPSET